MCFFDDISARIGEPFAGRSMPEKIFDELSGQKEFDTDGGTLFGFISVIGAVSHGTIGLTTIAVSSFFKGSLRVLSPQYHDAFVGIPGRDKARGRFSHRTPVPDKFQWRERSNGRSEIQRFSPAEWRVIREWLLSLQATACYSGSNESERIDGALESVDKMIADK
jgi:hypothetical protein